MKVFTVRFRHLLTAALLLVACQTLSSIAMADGGERHGGGGGGPLPLLGATALGQLGSVAGGAFLIWRRRRKAKASRATSG